MTLALASESIGRSVRFFSGLSKLRFSAIEKRDLVKSWFVISLAFTLAIVGFSASLKFFLMMIVSAITVGLGFLLHELAHKAVAVHYGLWAEYRSFDNMLLLALFLSLFGFVFAAPGAVFISPRISALGSIMYIVPVDRNGRISAAGPVVNYVLALMFIGLAFLVPALSSLAMFGAQINVWLGLFNMIPFLNFDGSKIWPWNKAVYLLMVGAGAGLMWWVGRIG